MQTFKSGERIILCIVGGLHFSLQTVLMMSAVSRIAKVCGMVLWLCAWAVAYRWSEPTPVSLNTLLIFVEVETIKSSPSAILEKGSEFFPHHFIREFPL